MDFHLRRRLADWAITPQVGLGKPIPSATWGEAALPFLRRRLLGADFTTDLWFYTVTHRIDSISGRYAASLRSNALFARTFVVVRNVLWHSFALVRPKGELCVGLFRRWLLD